MVKRDGHEEAEEKSETIEQTEQTHLCGVRIDRSCSKSTGLDRIKDCYAVILAPLTSSRQEGMAFVSVLRRWELHRAVGLCISTVWRHRLGVGLLPRQVSFDDL